jgi:K+-transporting ATPase KdpF subunit
MVILYMIMGVIAVFLGIYLLIALLKPELFP